jgi:hypothetical protein
LNYNEFIILYIKRNLIDRLKLLQELNSAETFEEQLVYWLFQILQALYKLHEYGILHKRISKGWIVSIILLEFSMVLTHQKRTQKALKYF